MIINKTRISNGKEYVIAQVIDLGHHHHDNSQRIAIGYVEIVNSQLKKKKKYYQFLIVGSSVFNDLLNKFGINYLSKDIDLDTLIGKRVSFRYRYTEDYSVIFYDYYYINNTNYSWNELDAVTLSLSDAETSIKNYYAVGLMPHIIDKVMSSVEFLEDNLSD